MKKCKFEERLQLTYDKGERYFEDKPVLDAKIDDLDMDLVNDYVEKIDYPKTALEYLKQNKGFVKEKDGAFQISTAAILLFGKNPQNFFPRARVRFIRYEGTEERFGTEMNVIKDVIFEGTILQMIKDAIAYLDTQIKEKTYLSTEGTFVTEEEYPRFVRQELIVNAVTHRAYSISGTDIQIKMFDDHLIVESPGKLPGLVKTDNMRYTHFSRNPKIAEYLKAYHFVKEYGEGVDRMCKELENVGLKNPVYYINAFMLQAIIYNDASSVAIGEKKVAIDREKVAISEQKITKEYFESLLLERNYSKITRQNLFKIYEQIETNQIFGTSEVAKILGFSSAGARKVLTKLIAAKALITVKGKGKGKYRFLNHKETPPM